MTRPSQPEGTSEVQWVWRSRPGTTEAGIFSVLAAIEVIIAVAAYWAYAIWAHTQVHLLVSVFVSPLLLLRSRESIDLGKSLFNYIDVRDYALRPIKNNNHTMSINEKIFSKTRLLFDYNSMSMTILSMIIFILLLLPLTLLATLAIRFYATFRYVVNGMNEISVNWWRTLFATDLLTIPEIIPGNTDKNSMFRIEKVVGDYSFEESKIKLTLNLSGDLFVGAILFGPTYLYRMSIKSTAWVHWPLAYIAKPLIYADDPKEVHARLWSDFREWLRRVLTLVTFLGVGLALFPHQSEIARIFPSGVISILEYAFVIDIQSLIKQPWRVINLISAIITLILFWYGCELSLLLKRAKERPDRLIRAASWAATLERAMRVRDICGYLFWALVFVHAVLWLAPSTDWIGAYPRELLQAVYGDFLPPSLR